MKRLAAMVFGLAVASTAAACSREEPAICRSSPPEDSRYYERWTNAVSAADCDELRPQNGMGLNITSEPAG